MRHLSTPDGVVEVIVQGADGPLLVMLPSLGRGADDFREVSARIAAEGFRVAAWQPRGIGGSVGPLDGITLHDLARDVAAVIEALCPAGAVVLGHAYGNWIARTVATDRPDLVDAVIVLAGLGRQPVDPEVTASIDRSADLTLPDAERLKHLQRAFFAPGNDASVWLGGWFPEVIEAQRLASRRTPRDSYFAAGTAPLLLIQPAEDTVALLQHAQLQKDELGDRMTISVVHGAGHAIVPEQPEQVATIVVGYLREVYAGGAGRPGSASSGRAR